MRRTIGQLMPNAQPNLAAYDPATFYIYLNSINGEKFKAAQAAGLAEQNLEHLKTLGHELRHNIDHFTTLWGQKNILKYLAAINARLYNNPENFKPIVDYKNEEKQLFYSRYFTVHFHRIQITTLADRWKWSPTVGRKFTASGKLDNERPILFIRFATQQGIDICRVPLSIVSLMETNAIAEEVRFHMGYLATLPGADRPFHFQIYQRETLLKLIYNQDAAIYNVAVHVVANLLDLTDLVEAISISSSIAAITLNLPHEQLMMIKRDHPKLHGWDTIVNSMIENHEYGFIFYLLVLNYSDAYLSKKHFDPEDVLSASNLPSIGDLEEITIAKMKAIEKEAMAFKNCKEVHVNHLLKGQKLFSALGLAFHKMSMYEAMEKAGFKPTILPNDVEIDLKDYSVQDLVKKQPLVDFDLSEWFNVAYAMNESMNEFYDIRGV